jgi:hypothetical protein
MNEFVYLYRGGEAGRSSQRAQQMMQRWMTLLKKHADEGDIKDRDSRSKLRGKLVKGKRRTVTDGPFAEAKDAIGGYTLVTAHGLDQAVELLKGCPFFEVDGEMEVRPIMKMSM